MTLKRFELEQEIVRMGQMIDDLRVLVDHEKLSVDAALALAEYYDMRFEILWKTFVEHLNSLPTTGYSKGAAGAVGSSYDSTSEFAGANGPNGPTVSVDCESTPNKRRR